MIEYNGKIDTIKMAGSVRLTKGGGALFSRATSNTDYKYGKIKVALPIKYNQSVVETEVPELSLVQQWNGMIDVFTHKNFIAEYGYRVYMGVPGHLYYISTLPKQTAKQTKLTAGTKIRLEINIPSVSTLSTNKMFEEFIVGKYEGDGSWSDMIWKYIMSHHDWEAYGIRQYELDSALGKNDLGLAQVDIAQNIHGRLVKDVLELVGATGFYARKNMHLWTNTTADGNTGITTYQSPNGIEFRKGKKSSEIYKFYDKELQLAQTYYNSYAPIYTPSSAERRKTERILEVMEQKDRTMLRYEVSLRRVSSVGNAIDRKYSSAGTPKKIYLTDILDNTIYSRVPQRVLKDGLLSIFGSEIEKEMTNIIIGEDEMTDTDILQEYSTKGLKFLGIKYLLDKGMTNDQLWPYLYKTAGLNYEVVRRLRNELRENNILNNMNDSHTRTLDTLRGVYKDLK